FLSVIKQDKKCKYDTGSHNITVRHIKDREIDQTEIKEVDHISEAYPVDHISHCPGTQKHRTDAQGKISPVFRHTQVKIYDSSAYQQRTCREDNSHILHHPKSSPSVFEITELKNAVYQDIRGLTF